MSTLAVMDKNGDTKTIWDKRNVDEVENARKTFERLKDKGYVAYRVDSQGKAAAVMHAFDAEAESIIMRPMAAGG